jgi:hypothetical protein
VLARIHRLEKVRYVSPYHLALAYLGVGDVEKTFELLERASRERDPALAVVTVEPRFDVLRTDARYLAVLDQLNMSSARRGTLVHPSTRVNS